MKAASDVVYSKNPDVVFRNIAGECILVPIKKNVADLESIYALNDTASRAWELIDGTRSVAEIKRVMIEEFDVNPREAEEDLWLLFNKLKDAGSIKEN